MHTATRSLEDTVIAITGAAGGIGSTTACLALEAGAKVVLSDLHGDRLRAIREEWGADRVALAVGDVRAEETSEAIVEAATASFGRLDSVVANAGIGFYGGLLDCTPTQIRQMLDVNVLGTVWLASAAVRQFRLQGEGGDILIIGSVAGMYIGGGKEAVYAATKGAQINLGHALDRELRGEGVRTTVIAPAGVNTAFAAGDGRFGGKDPSEGHFMQPGDIAGAILYALSQPRRMRTELWSMWSLAEEH